MLSICCEIMKIMNHRPQPQAPRCFGWDVSVHNRILGWDASVQNRVLRYFSKPHKATSRVTAK